MSSAFASLARVVMRADLRRFCSSMAIKSLDTPELAANCF
jgi:hypothetical protein